jgi:protease I
MKALLIIPPERFRDEEYSHTKEMLEKAMIGTVTASTTREAHGSLGAKVKPGLALNAVDISAYEAVVFIGGSGSAVFFNDPLALRIAKMAYDSGKVVAAICIAPNILANAGVLNGKRATAWVDEQPNLVAKGATWTGEAVTVDGKVITANGPKSAKDFGKAIARAIGAA